MVLAYTVYRIATLWPDLKISMVIVGTLAYFLLMFAWQFTYRFHPEFATSSEFIVLAWVGAIAMGLWATFMIFSIPVDLLQWGEILARKLGFSSEKVLS